MADSRWQRSSRAPALSRAYAGLIALGGHSCVHSGQPYVDLEREAVAMLARE
jgi:hypothetical protein